MALRFFDLLAGVRPAEALPYENTFFEIMHAENNISGQAAGILVKLSIDEVLIAYFVISCFNVVLSLELHYVVACLNTPLLYRFWRKQVTSLPFLLRCSFWAGWRVVRRLLHV
jgi:hypothetical protein